MHPAPSTNSVHSPLLADRYRPYKHVVGARHADTTVLLDADRGKYYTLNEVAGRVWELLGAGEPVLEIVHCVRDEYEVPVEQVEADVATLLDQFLQAALIERVRM